MGGRVKSGKVLLVCYYFPPLGGAGVARPLALYKHLPRYGYECDVLTVKPVAYRFFDPDLLEGVDTSHVYRSGSRDPQRLMRLLGMRTVKGSLIQKGRGMGDRIFPDPKKGWIRSAVKLGRVLAENRHYEAIISTSPPMSSHLIGMQLAEEFKIPWIADFRDFWTLYKAEDWFTDEKLIRKAQALLAKITETAAEVSVVNPSIAEYLGRGKTIYNGFDREPAKSWKSPGSSETFSIGILGTLDRLRPVEPLFGALSLLRDQSPDLFANVRIIQVGPIQGDDWQDKVRQYVLGGIIRQYPQTERKESIRILSETSLMYLGLDESAPGLLPIRLFDMVASGRPMLVCAPTGSVVRDIVDKTENGLVFTYDQLGTAAAYLEDLVARWKKGNLKIDPIPQYAEKHTSERMAESFAELIREVSSRGST